MKIWNYNKSFEDSFRGAKIIAVMSMIMVSSFKYLFLMQLPKNKTLIRQTKGELIRLVK